MPNNSEDQEVLNIGDDDGGQGVNDDGDVNLDDTDRGDDFVDPDAPVGPGDAGEGKGEADSSDGGDGVQGDGEGTGGNIPHSRLGEVARAKTASVAIGKGLVDGTVDRELIDELGGYDAVVKAVVNKELSLDDLQPVGGGEKSAARPVANVQQTPATSSDPNDPSNWDLDTKFIEYQELVDAGETRDAALMLRQLNKEERARERGQEVAAAAHTATMDHVKQLIDDFPVLNDQNSQEHIDVMVWADHFQRANGMTRSAALDKAVVKVGLRAEAGATNDHQNRPPAETAQQRTIRLRKEAAIAKGANASMNQPPPMGLGATPVGAAPPKDISKLSETEFAALTDAEKRAARGDDL